MLSPNMLTRIDVLEPSVVRLNTVVIERDERYLPRSALGLNWRGRGWFRVSTPPTSVVIGVKSDGNRAEAKLI